MAKETTVRGRVGYLRRLLARLNSNREELQHIEPSRARFEAAIGQIEEAADQQAFHAANKQESSQRLQSSLVEAERLATILQLAVKQHYGIRSEKLADFGLKPFRGRPRKTTPTTPEPEPPAPGPELTTPATPTTDRP